MNSILQLLQNIEDVYGVRICVHDISGITLNSKILDLPNTWKTHGCAYCNTVKQFASEKICMHQKEIALYKLKRNGVNSYYGTCCFGVCEYIRPVLIDNKLVAILFASGILEEEEEESLAKLQKRLVRIKKHSEEINDAFRLFASKAHTTKEELKFFADTVESFIRIASEAEWLHYVEAEGFFPVEPVSGLMKRSLSTILVSYLEENYKNHLSLKALSNRFFISESYINRLVKKEVGMSAKAYINKLRMTTAAKELIRSNNPIHEISEKVGITDINYFCRLFKATYNMTPLEYRISNHE